MFATVLPVMAPVLICVLLGVWWGRSRFAFHNDFVSELVLRIGAPALIIGTLGDTTLQARTLVEVVIATLVLLSLSALLALALCWFLGWRLVDIGIPLTFGNAGNMGLPLCLFALGQDGLSLALGVFLVTSLAHFSLGTALLSSHLPLAAIAKTPIIWSGVVVVAMLAADWQLPVTLANTLDILGGMVIPLMLLTLGVSLTQLRLRDAGQALSMGAARLLVGISAGLLTVWVLDLDGLLRGVVILQAATPAAIFNYLLAQQYRRSPVAVAGLVMTSTLLSFATIPLVLRWLV